MKPPATVLKIVVIYCMLLTACKHQSSTSFRSAIERQLGNVEKNIVSAAEAMPEDEFYFTPESLHIKGSEFKDVRTFAGQIKHLAADNFAIWAPITGDSLQADAIDVN